MKTLLILGTFLGGLSVALGAFGAHGLKDIVSPYGLTLWDKATYYQMIHSIMIVITAIFAYQLKTTSFFKWAGYLFLIGILCFSGSLFVIALTNITKLGMITPIGGVSFMLGWIMLLLGCLKFYK